MTENELLDAKLLYKFLQKKCVLYAYITNVIEQHRDDYRFRELYEKGDILGIIDLYDSSFYWSFGWSKTKEGFFFWNDLEREFMLFSEQFYTWKNFLTQC